MRSKVSVSQVALLLVAASVVAATVPAVPAAARSEGHPPILPDLGPRAWVDGGSTFGPLDAVRSVRLGDGATELLAASIAASGGVAATEDTIAGENGGAVPAGDLDGDGLADTLVGFARAGTSTIEVRRGDSSTLWALSRPHPTGAFPTPDLTGDGLPDLLVVSLETTRWDQHDVCPLYGSCVTVIDAGIVWSVSLAEGTSGDLAWETRFEGTIFSANEMLAYQLAYRNAWLFLQTSRDTVTANLIGATFAYAHGTQPVYAYHSESFVLDADDGAALYSRAPVGPRVVGGLLQVENGLGHGGTDYLWEESYWLAPPFVLCAGVFLVTACTPAAYLLSLEMVDGRSFSKAWSRVPLVTNAFGATAVGADLSGDGAADLLLHAGNAIQALSGRDGADLWPASVQGFPMATADLGGSEGPDVLVGDFSDVALGAIVRHVDGATGTVLAEIDASVPRSPGSYSAVVVLALGPDVDHDGVADFIVDVLTSNGAWTSRGTAYSGATGEVILAREASGFRYLVPGAAQGPPFYELAFSADTDDVRFGALSVVGEERWARVDSAPEPSAWVSIWPTDDATGDGHGEVLYTVSSMSWSGQAWVVTRDVHHLSGADGAATWSLHFQR